jgi:hypothetical protein
MFLIFRLQRPDVLPLGDLGIVNAIQKAYGLRKKPTADRMLKLGEAWRPYRSIASWYLWRSLDNEPVSAKATTRQAPASTPPSPRLPPPRKRRPTGRRGTPAPASARASASSSAPASADKTASQSSKETTPK